MHIGKTLYVTTARQWRAWLNRNHAKAKEIWLVYYKKASGKSRIPYNDAVDQALCFGWIDSIVKSIDEHSYAQRWTPRRKGSLLSELNKERIMRMIKTKQMTPAGMHAVRHAFDGKAKNNEIPKDILRTLKKDSEVWKHFMKFPGSYKRIRIGWIDAARGRPALYKQRLEYFVKMTRMNKRFGMVQ